MRYLISAVLGLMMTAACFGQEGKALFNGKDLSGWEGNADFWKVEDGAIVGQTTAEKPTKGNTFLIWKDGTLKDFELRVKFRLRNHNSGIQYRSKVIDQKNFVVGGYQADMADNAYLGICYEERGRGIIANVGQKVTITQQEGKPDFKLNVTGSTGATPEKVKESLKPGQWNEYVIVAKGNHLTQTLNGITTVEITDEDARHAAKEGILALQLHAGPPMKVEFKEIVLKKLD